MVFYRKYRPQRIKELDLENVRSLFQDIVSSGEIPHAFLFTGPKGTGKTSSARIIAKIINCEKIREPADKDKRKRKSESKKQINTRGKDIEPCNACDTCVSITHGSNLDVLEIDAASNRGIDEIRSLRENIKLSPVSARKKIYIIDEVHMLTMEAFNALLKTIEEPPNHVYFILATTEPQKLPDTVVSRCFPVQFKKASAGEIVHALQRVMGGERLNVADDVLSAIAKQADGSFRDAVKILEQASVAHTSKDDPITLLDVERYGVVLQRSIKPFVEYLSKRDSSGALSYLEERATEGADMRFFVKGTLEYLHDQFLSMYGITDTKEQLSMTREQLVLLLERLSRAWVELKNASVPQLPVQIAVVEWLEDTSLNNKEEKKSKNSTRKENGQGYKPVYTQKKHSHTQSLTNKTILNDLIEAVKPYNHSVAGLLRSCEALTSGDDTIIINARYQFHYDRLCERKTKEILSELASKIVGRSVNVKPKLQNQ